MEHGALCGKVGPMLASNLLQSCYVEVPGGPKAGLERDQPAVELVKQVVGVITMEVLEMWSTVNKLNPPHRYLCVTSTPCRQLAWPICCCQVNGQCLRMDYDTMPWVMLADVLLCVVLPQGMTQL
jgi:hypothetical protein